MLRPQAAVFPLVRCNAALPTQGTPKKTTLMNNIHHVWHQNLIIINNQGMYPRSGVQYGSTYVLYRQRPAICHSDFCVVVLDAAQQNHMPWFALQIANRLASQVSKRLLLLYVGVPVGVDTRSLECLRQAAVQEVSVRRWTLSRGLPQANGAAGGKGGKKGGQAGGQAGAAKKRARTDNGRPSG